MRPLSLKGHDRSLTHVKLNREGDLLFTSSKGRQPCVWYTENGERIGTYEGHNGVIWSLDVSYDTSKLLTAGGDNTCIFWDVATGHKLHGFQTSTPVRTVGFSYSGQVFFYGCQKMTTYQGAFKVFDLRDPSSLVDGVPAVSLSVADKLSPVRALWTHLDYMITSANDNGSIHQYDIRAKQNEPVNFEQVHSRNINDLQMSLDQTMLISASKDKTAKLLDSKTLEVVKTYKAERPVNSAAISPIRDHVVLGGGEDSMQVTQTAAGEAHFEAKFYHLVFEEEFARLKGHFGPINSLCFHPDGKTLITGAEDGYIRIQTLDQDYFDFDFEH